MYVFLPVQVVAPAHEAKIREILLCKNLCFCKRFREKFFVSGMVFLREKFWFSQKFSRKVFVFAHVLDLDAHSVVSWIRICIPNEKFSQKLSRFRYNPRRPALIARSIWCLM
jgi:hypothetical protein